VRPPAKLTVRQVAVCSASADAAAGGFSAAQALGEDATADDLLQRRQGTQRATPAVNESGARR
jgi:hypothetical protein